MLGLSSSLIKKAGMPLQWIKDGLKLYMPYRGDVTNKGTQFVGTGSTSFDGTNDYIAVADSNDFSFGDGSTDSAFSISAWVNMDDTSDFRIINKGIYNSTAEWGFEVAGNTLILYLYDESVSSTYESASFALTTTGTWIHVACTYTGVGGTSANAGIKLYKNGSAVAVSTNQLPKESDIMMYVSMGLSLVATDYIEVYANLNSVNGANGRVTGGTSALFWGFKLG